MFVWNVEEMKLMKDTSKHYSDNGTYACENTTQQFDKIMFIDSKTNKGMSALLNVIHAFDEDKVNLPLTKGGFYRSSTIRNWLKKRPLNLVGNPIDLDYNTGTYRFLGVCRNICYGEDYLATGDTYANIVDECFHRLLILCETEEKAYFEKNDEYSILKNEFMSFYATYKTTFGLPLYFTDEGDIMLSMKSKDRKLKESELKMMIARFTALQARDRDLTEQTVNQAKKKIPNILL